ncbi:MAG: putative tellurite resistance protein B-like protein [Cocleimonas sp.]|jgi:uncharacterized tellurite resistance protein B-like protein
MENIRLAELDILSAFTEATQEADAFENHPMAEHNLEEQLLYLQGLAMVMNVDNDIHETELEYLRILIKSFGLDGSITNDCVKFAQAPDKDSIQAFVRCFRRKPIAQLFLFDALMMTRRDGKVHDKEMALVNAMASQLEILKGTQQDIFDLFCHIKNRNWQESTLYFSSHLLNPDHFKHLLAYHELDLDELMEETKSIHKQRLKESVSQKCDCVLDGQKWKKIKSYPLFNLLAEKALEGMIVQNIKLNDDGFVNKNSILFDVESHKTTESKKAPVNLNVIKCHINEGKKLTANTPIASVIFKDTSDIEALAKSKFFRLGKKSKHVIIGGFNNIDVESFLIPDILIPFLQYQLDLRQIRVSGVSAYKKIANGEQEYCQLMNLGIEFDQESNAFSIGNQALKATDNYLPVDLLNDFFSLMYH